jgi:hypothetical protein
MKDQIISDDQQHFDPVKKFTDTINNMRFLQGILILCLFAWPITLIIQADIFSRHRQFIEHTADDRYLPCSSAELADDENIHRSQAIKAIAAFYSRNPKGYNNEREVKKLFVDIDNKHTARIDVMKEETEWIAKYGASGLHQSVEITETELKATSNDGAIVDIAGQLILETITSDQTILPEPPKFFRIELQMTRNPDVLSNGLYPTAVCAYKEEISDKPLSLR